MLTEQEMKIMCQMSLERVIKMTRAIAEGYETTEDQQEINREDWEILQPIVLKVWEQERQKAFVYFAK